MTEAFRSGSHGLLASLRDASALQQPVATQQQLRRKQCQQLRSLAHDFVSGSPLEVSVPELMDLAAALHAKRQYSLALTSCCNVSLRLVQARLMTAKDMQDTLAVLEAQVQITAVRSKGALLAVEDPELSLPDSLSQLIAILNKLQTAMQQMLPEERNHWLVYQGAVVLREICADFRGKPGQHTLQFLAFAALALDTDLTFSLPEYLHLRISLYLDLARCQQACGMSAQAVSTLQQGLAAIAAIEKLEQLDPLPPSSEAQAAYTQAKTRLNTALFAMTAAALPSEQAVKDALQNMFTSDSDRLAALAVSLLPIAPNRVLRHQPCPAALTKLLTITEALLQPHLKAFTSSLETEAQAESVLEVAKGAVSLETAQVLSLLHHDTKSISAASNAIPTCH